MIDAWSSDNRANSHASCTMAHGSLNAVSQQIVAGAINTFLVIPAYLVNPTPDEINVYKDDREVTLLAGSGGPTYA